MPAYLVNASLVPKPLKHFVACEGDTELLYQAGATEWSQCSAPLYTRALHKAYAFTYKAATERMAVIVAEATGVSHVVTPAPAWL